MKRLISSIPLSLYCMILFGSLNISGEEKTASPRKTVIIKYNPDNRDIAKIIMLETVSYQIIKEFCNPMLTETGKMIYMPERQSVIIFDKKKSVDKIAAFIKELDLPAVNIRIDVDFSEIGNSKDDSLNIAFGNRKTPNVNNQIIIRNGKIVKINRIKIDAAKRSGTTSRNTSQFILTKSGSPASLWVGKRIVDPTWLRNKGVTLTRIYPIRGGGAIVIPGSDNEIVWRDIGSALYVLPTYLGNDKIKLELYPVVSYLVDDPDDVANKRTPKRQTAMVQDIKTSLILKSGQKVSIGGVISSNKKFYTNLFGPDFLSIKNENSVLDMYVTATVVKPGSSGRKSYIPRTP